MKTMLLATLSAAAMLVAATALAQDASPTPGHDQAPGQQFHITVDDLPAPVPVDPKAPVNPPKKVERGEHLPLVPEGFQLKLYIENFGAARRLAVDAENVVMLAQQDQHRIMKLRDIENDGFADTGGLVLEQAANPFGLAFVTNGEFEGDLLVADQDAVYRIPLASVGFNIGQVTPDGMFGEVAGHISHEVAYDAKASQVYVSVGSVNNVAVEEGNKATIQRVNLDGSDPVTFASGLRNVTGMDFEPGSNALYAVVMERDGMGDQLVPDFLARIDEGDHFGWPYQYTGGFVQPELQDQLPKLKAAKMPDVLFEAHSAPLDMVFIPDSWPEEYRGDALVALHGSSGASVPTGYKVVRVPFTDGKPDGSYENFMTGFWVSGDATAEVWGRPAALAFGPDGGLYVSDDFGGTIWKVMPHDIALANQQKAMQPPVANP
ncbi:MAG: sorbosone dehydrogenase [Hyphomicrobiales bacterium]|nr:MAG: sorbosone dehydrogenase [Hyphomicrobiales bacterium]